MMVLITYDINIAGSGAKRLRHVAKHCMDYGIRVQNSVFECDVTPGQWQELKHKLLSVYNPEKDSFRFYFLGKNWLPKLEHFGVNKKFSIYTDPLIVD